MVKRIIWSTVAKTNRREILTYWLFRNKSNVYPIKLNGLFNEAIKNLSEHNMPRRHTDIIGVYVKIVRDYKIFFEEDDNVIIILSI